MTTPPPIQLFLCAKADVAAGVDGHCAAAGAREVYAACQQVIEARGWQDKIEVRYSGCLDHCDRGPAAAVIIGRGLTRPPHKLQRWYWGATYLEGLTPEAVPEALQRLVDGAPVSPAAP